MSISDSIVVMKDGEIHQIGKPQTVYDDPINLFVAKFLGTPPINVFAGEVKSESLYIGDENVLSVPGAPDGKVSVGIRPEGFIPDTNGAFCCGLDRVEIMGRDTSVVFNHPDLEGEQGRAIISAEASASLAGESVRFTLKPSKTYIFNADGNRIRFGI